MGIFVYVVLMASIYLVVGAQHLLHLPDGWWVSVGIMMFVAFIMWISSMFMIGPLKWIPKLVTRIAIIRLMMATKNSALSHGVRCSTSWFGAYDVDPKNLCVVIAVGTDVEKEKLRQAPAFLSDLRNNLVAVMTFPL